MTLFVGQELLFVPADPRWRTPSTVTVEKIGRRWATLAGNRGRVDLMTLYADGAGFASPGRCYLSAAAWEAHKRAEAAWRAFVKTTVHRNGPPAGATEEAIYAAAEALGVREEVEKGVRA